jgi:hypothetical protein
LKGIFPGSERRAEQPVILDTTHAIAERFNAKVTPQTVILDPAGNVVFDGMPDDTRRFLYDPPKAKPGKPAPVPDSFLAKALAQGLAGKAVTETPLREAGCSIAWLADRIAEYGR